MNGIQRVTRFVGPIIIGFSIIFPLLNQSGTITIFEAILGIWLLFLVPAFLLYRNLRKNASKRMSFTLAMVIYAMGASLYSLIEPIIAGYNVFPYMFLIPIPASFIIMLPSILIRNRTIHAKPKTDIPSDPKYSEYLRKKVERFDQNPPEVYISPAPVRIGSAFVSHTDGKPVRIIVRSEAIEKFREDEIESAILKIYFDMKEKGALKSIYRLNFVVLFFLDGTIILTTFANYISDQNVKLVILPVLLILVLGFMALFPTITKKLVLVKEISSDSSAAKLIGDIESLKSYISKSAENYVVSPMAVGRRYERIINSQKRLAQKRIRKLELSFNRTNF